jgi:hypothetical protein
MVWCCRSKLWLRQPTLARRVAAPSYAEHTSGCALPRWPGAPATSIFNPWELEKLVPNRVKALILPLFDHGYLRELSGSIGGRCKATGDLLLPSTLPIEMVASSLETLLQKVEL